MNRRAVAAASLTATAIGLAVWAARPDWVESGYVGMAGPWLQGIATVPARWLPFALSEWVVVGAVVLVFAALGRSARRFWWQPVARRSIAVRLGANIGLGLLAGVVWFYAVWGLSYARPPIDARLGWDPAAREDPTPAELDALAAVLIDRVNDLYLTLHGTPDGFVPTRAPDGLQAADRAIEAGYRALAARPEWPDDLGRSRGPSKPLLSSQLFSWLHIGGMYFPFTAEATVNALQPQWQQPHTRAHEKAHQRFVANEGEANFVGFLACIHATDPFVQYSGWLFAQRSVLFAQTTASPWEFTRRVLERHPGVQRDVLHARAFWDGYTGGGAELSAAINHAYLRANRVDGGVTSYSQSQRLVVRWLQHELADPRGGIPGAPGG